MADTSETDKFQVQPELASITKMPARLEEFLLTGKVPPPPKKEEKED